MGSFFPWLGEFIASGVMIFIIAAAVFTLGALGFLVWNIVKMFLK